MDNYIVYVKTNGEYITLVNSSAFITDTTDWIEIDKGVGDKYHHAQGNYFDKPILTEDGAYRYKLVDSTVIECSDDEIMEQIKSMEEETQPSQLDIIEAQVTYTAMMTDTLLEV